MRVGLASPPPLGPGFVVLETTGRRSGTRREVPLAAIRVGRTVFVSTVRGNSRWLSNLEANPAGGLWACGESTPVRATVRRGPLNVAMLSFTRPEPVAASTLV